MKIQHLIRTVDDKGHAEEQVQDFAQEVIFGRGGRSHVLIAGRLAALEHARFSLRENDLLVEALSPSHTVAANDAPVIERTLKRGDRVTIGPVTLDIKRDGDTWVLLEERRSARKFSEEEKIAAQTRAFDVRTKLPSIAALSALLAVAVAMFFFVWPFFGRDQRLWSSGPISAHHKMIATDCRMCHEKSFQAVNDQQCLACHNLSEHSPALTRLTAHNQSLSRQCVDCHLEHNGTHNLTNRSSGICTDCHATIKTVNPESTVENVTSFEDHPEFAVTLAIPDIGTGKRTSQRVRVSQPGTVNDPTPLKLNHRLHLAPDLRGPDGPVTLQCDSCHHFTAASAIPQPINMKKDCSGCHTLGFDERLPDKQVPHGDPDVVFNALFAEYARVSLGAAVTSAPAPVTRALPGRVAESAPGVAVPLNRAEVLSQSRDAERQLFERTACQLCHMVNRTEVDEKDPARSIYSIVKPEVPVKWFTAARFDHAAHREVRCESCHTNVLKSEKTTDLLLPTIRQCRECHHSGHGEGRAEAQCVTCHSYHDSIDLAREKKRDIGQIVKP